jgi:hypothetical protein
MQRPSVVSLLVICAMAIGVPCAALAGDFACEVADVEGDLNMTPGRGFDGAAYQDILSTAIERAQGQFVFSMEVAAPIPATPDLKTPHGLLLWMWGMNTGPGVPQGFPLAPGVAGLLDFWIHVAWDGSKFEAVVIDRRPASQGDPPLISQVPFVINGASLTILASASLLGEPSTFSWGSSTWIWPTRLGTTGPHRVDQAPDVGASPCPAV